MRAVIKRILLFAGVVAVLLALWALYAIFLWDGR